MAQNNSSSTLIAVFDAEGKTLGFLQRSETTLPIPEVEPLPLAWGCDLWCGMSIEDQMAQTDDTSTTNNNSAYVVSPGANRQRFTPSFAPFDESNVSPRSESYQTSPSQPHLAMKEPSIHRKNDVSCFLLTLHTGTSPFKNRASYIMFPAPPPPKPPSTTCIS